MNSDLAVAHATYSTGESGRVRFKEVALSNDDTSGQPTAKDWETWIVRIADFPSDGHRDSDGVVWPTTEAIQVALQLIGQMRTHDFAEPTELVPSGDGGIVLSRRSGNLREEIEISESGDAEWLLFQDSRLTDRTPW